MGTGYIFTNLYILRNSRRHEIVGTATFIYIRVSTVLHTTPFSTAPYHLHKLLVQKPVIRQLDGV